MPAFLQTSCSEDRRFNYGFYIATKRQLVFGTPQDGLENKLHASEKQLPNLFLTPRWPRQSIKSAKLIIEKVCVCVCMCVITVITQSSLGLLTATAVVITNYCIIV